MTKLIEYERALLNDLTGDNVINDDGTFRKTLGFPDVDQLVLGAEVCPGIVKISGANSPRKWDKKGGYGISGSTVTFTGADLSSFDVQVTIWLPEHWNQWIYFAKKVLEKPVSKNPKLGLGIVHPLVNRPPLRIIEVIVEDVSQFEPDETGELWTCTIKLTEYRKPREALVTATSSIPALAPKAPSAQDAADRKILELQAEMNNLL